MPLLCGFGDDGSCQASSCHPRSRSRPADTFWVHELPGVSAFPCHRSGCDRGWSEADPSLDTVRLGRMDVQQMVADAEKFLSPPRVPPPALAPSPNSSLSTPEFCPVPRSYDAVRAVTFSDAISDQTSGSSQGAGVDVARRVYDAPRRQERPEGGPPPSAGSPPRVVARREGVNAANRLRTNAICMPGVDRHAPVTALPPQPSATEPAKSLRQLASAPSPSLPMRPKAVPSSAGPQQARCPPQTGVDADQLRQVQQAKEWVGTFLQRHGYVGVNAKRTRLFKSKYPLHTAVKLGGSGDTVRLLLWAMADPALRDSSGLTPLQLAEKINVQGSHDSIIEELTKSAKPSAVAPHVRRAGSGARGGA
jgi:hypothetical protein